MDWHHITRDIQPRPTRDWFMSELPDQRRAIFRWYPADNQMLSYLGTDDGIYHLRPLDFTPTKDHIFGFFQHPTRQDLIPFKGTIHDLDPTGSLLAMRRMRTSFQCVCGDPNSHLDEKFVTEWQRWTA